MRAIAAAAVLLPLLVTGCPEELDCTAIAAVSVAVTVIDPDGQPVSDALVTYQEQGGAPMECEHLVDAYFCGYEVGGELLIRVAADGFQVVEEPVFVPQGQCHVEGQSLEVQLQEIECTDEEVPSAIVTVVDLDGAAIADAEVSYAPRDELWAAPEPCEPHGPDATFVCGYEMDGILDLWAEAPGFLSAIGEVEVLADECHVITEEYTFELESDE